MLLLDLFCCYSRQNPCLACTFPDPSAVPSLLSLGMDNPISNHPLAVSHILYRSRAILVGRTGCNRGSLYLVNYLSTYRSCSQHCDALIVLCSPFYSAASFLNIPLILLKASSVSSPKFSYARLLSRPPGSCFHPSGSW